MVARVATTLICLGYGVVRSCISWPEIFVLSGLGVCYFIAVGALEISHILNQSDGDVKPPAEWEILVIVTNACFGGWIFTSLALTKKNLAAFGQVFGHNSHGLEVDLDHLGRKSFAGVFGPRGGDHHLASTTKQLAVLADGSSAEPGARHARVNLCAATSTLSSERRSFATMHKHQGISLSSRKLWGKVVMKTSQANLEIPSRKSTMSNAPTEDDDSSQRASDNSLDSTNHDKVDEFSVVPTQISENAAQIPSANGVNRPGSYHDKPVNQGINDNSSNAVIPSDPHDGEDPPPWKAPAKSGGGRRLTFADETGGTLAEINYSNKTHYSKQTGPGSLGDTGRACCAIS
ncbi:hypothetical protein FI667_g1914, partial [Globisporangium splendens]